MEVSNKLDSPGWEQDTYSLLYPLLLNGSVVS